MLKRFAETFAVLVVTAGLMAGGAALYAWLGPESGDEPTQQVPILTFTPAPTSPHPWPFSTYNHPSGLWRIDYPIGWEGPDSGIPKIYGSAEWVDIGTTKEGVAVMRSWNDDHGDDLYTYAARDLATLSDTRTHPIG